MKKLIYSIAALGLLASSCSKNDGGFKSVANTQVKISTSSITRATTPTSAYAGTDLGLSLDYGVTDRYSVTDSKWSYDAVSSTWSTEATVLWKNDTDPVDILAFAPYEDDFFQILADNKIAIGARKVPFYIQADQSSGIVESDFVAFESLQFVPSAANLTNRAVPITFEHVLSQLNLTLTYGEEFYEFFPEDGVPTIDYVEVNAYQIAFYDFDAQTTSLITKKIDKNGTPVTPEVALSKIAVKAYPTTANKAYTVILPPQTYIYNSVPAENVMLTVYVKYMDNATEVTRAFEYYVPTAGYTFEQGKSYTMNVRVGKDRLYIDGSVTVEAWNDGGEDLPLTGGDAEEDDATFGN